MASRDLPPGTSSPGSIFIKSQFLSKPCRVPHNTDLSGKVGVVTGASVGMGFECCRQLLSLKLSRLIVAVRSIEKGETAAAKLRKQFPGSVVEVWSLEMSSYQSIQLFTQRVDTQLSRLDIVILNAAVIKTKFDTVSGTGHEETVQVNYLSTILLVLLLLPISKNKSTAGNPGRITIVNSSVALSAKFQNRNKSPLLASFDEKKSFDSMETYACSKLLSHLFLYKLTDYVSANDVIVNIVDPGFVKGTQLHRESSGLASAMFDTMKSISARKLEDGVSTYLDASITKGKESHGCYIMDWKIHPFAALLYTPSGKKTMERLWDETLDELSFANVKGILDSMKAHSS